MVALEHQGTTRTVVVEEMTSCRAFNDDIRVNFLSVEGHVENHSFECDVHDLPLAGGFGGFNVGALLGVEGAVLGGIAVRLAEAIQDLQFVASSEINSAIAVGRKVILNVHLKIAELGVGDDVAANGGVFENAVFDDPVVRLVASTHMPTCEVLADEFNPFSCHGNIPFRCLVSGGTVTSPLYQKSCADSNGEERMSRLVYVTMVIASSADGKISTRDGAGPRFTSAEDKALLRRLRAACDAVLLGAKTVVHDDPTFRLPLSDLQERLRRGQSPTPIRAVVSRRGSVSPEARLFRGHLSPAVVFVGSECPVERRTLLASVADVHVVEDVREVVEVLGEEYAVRKLLLEGGGETNFAFLEAGLVDELYLTLAPYLVGGSTVPTPVGGAGFELERIVPLRLLSLRVEGNEVFLHYKIARPV